MTKESESLSRPWPGVAATMTMPEYQCKRCGYPMARQVGNVAAKCTECGCAYTARELALCRGLRELSLLRVTLLLLSVPFMWRASFFVWFASPKDWEAGFCFPVLSVFAAVAVWAYLYGSYVPSTFGTLPRALSAGVAIPLTFAFNVLLLCTVGK